ncbi:serine/threonine-protein kinase [Isosphaeraceae bacterium EP7]
MPESETSPRPFQEARIGSYRLVQPLGSGGMSSVFRAIHDESGHEVAIKVLPRSLAKNPTILHRFLREAKNAESLEHPSIVTIFDRGADQGRFYLVLEFVEGGDLHDRIRKDGPLPIPIAVEIVKGVAAALKYAASRGVIHRDVKPANILQSPDGVVKVIDLGLALQADTDDERVTRDGTTVGTVDYMSPEQARDSRAATVQSDIYSLGCTFYFLLTGAPPFPGGTVTEKLSRHYREAPPDPRSIRPEIPETLVEVIQSMMAKRPEDRQADYDALISDLDAATDRNSASTMEASVLDVMLDDEADGKILPRPERAPAERFSAPISQFDLKALSGVELEVATDQPLGKGGRDLSKLRVFDELRTRARELASHSESFPLSAPTGPDRRNIQAPPAGQLSPTSGRSEAPTHVYVGFGVIIGLAIALLGVGLTTILKQEIEKELETVSGVTTVIEPPPVIFPPVVTPKKSKPAPIAGAPVEPPWLEPTDPEREIVAETIYPPGREDAILADFVGIDADPPSSPKVIVRRVAHPADPTAVPDLRRAFDSREAEIEIADNGPFFETDFRMTGKTRRIRARAGYRPILAFTKPAVANNSSAIFQLQRAKLILEGLDLVIQVKKLPAAHLAVFECGGSDLILRDCTVTLLAADGQSFPLVKVIEPTDRPPGPSRIILDRTTIRTDVPTVFQLTAGRCDLAVVRSVVLGGQGPLVSVEARTFAGPPRRLNLVRSIVAGQGPFAAFHPSLTESLSLRSLGSTFARLAGRDSVPLLTTPEAATTTAFDWEGQDDRFVGWTSLLNAGATTRLANLPAARAAWPDFEVDGREAPGPWILSPSTTKLDQLELLAPERLGTLTRVAVPSPWLGEKTLDVFKLTTIPELLLPGALLRQAPAQGDAVRPPMLAVKQDDPDPSVSHTDVDLVFRADVGPWYGDIGRFLVERTPPDAVRVRVSVIGASSRFTSPILMPEGVSLEIDVVPPSAGEEHLSWKTNRSANGGALFATKGGDLVLRGVHLRREKRGPDHLVRVEAGHLVMTNCLLTSESVKGYPGDELIEFRAFETRPLRSRTRPFVTPWDLPTCLIRDSILMQGGGAVLVAEVARGLISLTNCAIAGGQDSIRLLPEEVSRSRFFAELQMTRCTITAGRAAITIGSWPTDPPGPDRPWLISSKECLFIDPFPERAMDVLRADPDGLSSGVANWQGDRDVFQVQHFLGSSRSNNTSSSIVNVKRDWIDLWGPSHIRDAIGPIPSNRGPFARLVVDRPTPGTLKPGDLARDFSNTSETMRLRSVGADYGKLPAPARASQARPLRRR